MLATAGLAAAFAPKGIRINGINPGSTLTGRVQEGLAVEAKMTGLAEEELLQRMQARIPLGRLGTPEEVAQVALFLASDPRELRHGRDRAHGRRSESGHLNAGAAGRSKSSASRARHSINNSTATTRRNQQC